jgi:hypothetical protein
MTNLNESMTSVSPLAMTPGLPSALRFGWAAPIVADTDDVQLFYSSQYLKFDPSLSDFDQAKAMIDSYAAVVVFLGMIVDDPDEMAATDRYMDVLADPEAQQFARDCITTLKTIFIKERLAETEMSRFAGAALGIALFVETLEVKGYASMSPALDVAQIHLVDDLEFLMPGLIMIEAPSAATTPPPNLVPSKPAPLVDNMPAASATIGTALENWIGTKGSKSEIARRRSAVELFLKATGISLEAPVDALGLLAQPNATAFVRLIDAVGPGWGQAGQDRDKSSVELIALCTGSTPPAWSLRPRTAAGNAKRIAYAKRFLDHVSAHHVPVPHAEWHWV